jgi:hypothetical protein
VANCAERKAPRLARRVLLAPSMSATQALTARRRKAVRTDFGFVVAIAVIYAALLQIAL